MSLDALLHECCLPVCVLGTATGQTTAPGFLAGWASMCLSKLRALNLEHYSFFARISLVSPSPPCCRPSFIRRVHLLAKMEMLTKSHGLLASSTYLSGFYGDILVLSSYNKSILSGSRILNQDLMIFS